MASADPAPELGSAVYTRLMSGRRNRRAEIGHYCFDKVPVPVSVPGTPLMDGPQGTLYDSCIRLLLAPLIVP
jgi:hypothetical protein